MPISDACREESKGSYRLILPAPLSQSIASFKVSGDYLPFLERLSPEKRPDRVIEIARLGGLPLKIMGKVTPSIAPTTG